MRMNCLLGKRIPPTSLFNFSLPNKIYPVHFNPHKMWEFICVLKTEISAIIDNLAFPHN